MMKIIGKIVFVSLVCIAGAIGILISISAVKAEDSAKQASTGNDSKQPVAIETKSGDVFVVYIIRETEEEFFVQNLNDTIEGPVARSEIINVRKPTEREIQKTKERLGIIPKQAISVDNTGNQIPINDDGKEAVALELKNGDTAVVFILKETKDDLLVQNLNDTIEVIVLRSEITGVRKPTAEEIQKAKERLGMTPKEVPSQETK